MSTETCNCPRCREGIEAPHEYHLERRPMAWLVFQPPGSEYDYKVYANEEEAESDAASQDETEAVPRPLFFARGGTAAHAPGSNPQSLLSMEAGQLAWDSLASGPRPPLSDEQIKERCEAAGIRWIEPDDDPCGFPGSFDMVTMAEMRALLTNGAHGTDGDQQ